MKVLIRFVCLILALASVGVPLVSQEPPPAQNAQQAPPSRRFGRGAGLTFGTVRSVGVNQLTVLKQDGSTVTVQVNSQTMFRDHGKPIELEDLKPGDRVVVNVQAPANSLSGSSGSSGAAEKAGSGNPDAAAAANSNPGPSGSGGPSTVTAAVVQRVPASAAATFVGDRAFGRITAISGNQLTVQGRQGEKVIVVSKDTEFSKDGQPATLQDFKVGDPILASGKETNGQFMANFVVSREMRPGGGAGFGGQRPDSPVQGGQKQGGAPPPNP
ncbi:MAG TPA: DUF5666 domain-containing protein [Terriglobia bacterium]